MARSPNSPNPRIDLHGEKQSAKPRLDCSPKGITPPRVISSVELLAGEKLLVIDHAGEQYRLMVTKNDKLILQK